MDGTDPPADPVDDRVLDEWLQEEGGDRRRLHIGCNVERSFFQRRAGLATLTATTAAGHQHYDVQDVEIGEALRLAEELLPELAEPFLERAPG